MMRGKLPINKHILEKNPTVVIGNKHQIHYITMLPNV